MPDLAKNKKACHNYQVLDKYECGIVLTGTEVKSCRLHNINFVDAYAQIQDGEVQLYNVHISEYKEGNRENHEPKRVRKLLLHKAEIRKIASNTQKKGLTLIPLSFYLKKGKIKVCLGACKGKTKSDKREVMKKKQVEQDLKRIISG